MSDDGNVRFNLRATNIVFEYGGKPWSAADLEAINKVSLSDWFKAACLSPLARQVADLGVCPKCHQRTVEECGTVCDGAFRVRQCRPCKTAFVDKVVTGS